MNEVLKTRQICFMLAAYGAVTKLMSYPTLLADGVGADIIFPALFALVLQAAAVFLVSFLSSKTDKTFFALVEDALGKTVARAVYFALGVWFLLSAIFPVTEQRMFVHDAFYDTVPSLYIFLPFFAFSIYAGAKSLTNAGRCADLCFPIFVAACGVLLIMSVGQGDYSNLLPVLKQPAENVLNSTLSSLFRFSESAFLIIFLGRFKYKKYDCARLTCSYLFGGAVVIVFLAAFYALYGPLAPSGRFLLVDVAAFFSAVSVVGRVDLYVTYLLDVAVLFAIVLHVQAFVHCMCTCTNYQNRALWSVAANAVLIGLSFALNNRHTFLYSVAYWAFIPALVFAYLLPASAWLLRRAKNETQ